MGEKLDAPWFTSLPEGWKVLPFKRLARVREGQIDPRDEGISNLPLFAPNHIESGTGRLLGMKTASEQGAISGKYPVEKGEIVYSKIRPALRKVIIAPRPGICSADMYAIRPEPQVSAKFLFWSMLSEGFSAAAVLASDRVAMPKVNRETLADFPLPWAPLPTQRAIAAFLDRKTAAIDALIRNKERLIELLAEQRAALIHRAVTRGLDPDVEMKDSGVEWIGEVPAHWEVLRTRFLSDMTTGGRDTQDATDDGEYPFFVRSQTVRRIDTWSFDGEAVLTSGDGAGVGKIFHHHVGELEYHQRVYLFHRFRRVLGRYFYFFLREHLLAVVLAGTAKSTVDSLRAPMLLNFPIAVGPMAEQQQIVRFLDDVDRKQAAVVTALVRQLARLREYRQALITAAVTGQLDIPSEAAA